jgi:hypothetical protein
VGFTAFRCGNFQRGRRKIATLALARHLLRIAYYIVRDGTVDDPKRLRVDVDDARHAA